MIDRISNLAALLGLIALMSWQSNLVAKATMADGSSVQSYVINYSENGMVGQSGGTAALTANTIADLNTQKPYAIVVLAALWRFNFQQPKEIFVCWEVDGWDQEKAWVRIAIERTWGENSGLVFSGWNMCEGFEEAVRIMVVDNGALAERIGVEIRGEIEGLKLDFTLLEHPEQCRAHRKTCIENDAIHEFGHAIGFAHEQNRQDVANECHHRRQGPNGDLPLTPFDPRSIMNYCSIVFDESGSVIPLEERLSAGDIQAVQAMYCPPWAPLCEPTI